MNRPLKWHKFLVYFSLWASAVFVFMKGANLIALGIFGDTDPQVPEPTSLKVLDIAYGVIYIALAVYHIYTRYQLARFKKGAPKHLLILYVIVPVVEALYIPLTFIAVDIPVSALLSDPAKAIGGTIGGVFGIWLVCVLNKFTMTNAKNSLSIRRKEVIT